MGPVAFKLTTHVIQRVMPLGEAVETFTRIGSFPQGVSATLRLWLRTHDVVFGNVALDDGTKFFTITRTSRKSFVTIVFTREGKKAFTNNALAEQAIRNMLKSQQRARMRLLRSVMES